ncbi:MAG: alpha/beta fold hydrolase [bacterium]|nr:alpha/beta fold hydrolase [Gammaproteobacteria bacterium]HIL97857.1 alpha/beta fold hydrolase [Pseudomonadales bacterium]
MIRLALLLLVYCPLCACASALKQHAVVVDNHEFALWHKQVKSPRATVLLLHGRTYSSLPDFDLRVPGEDLSFMDGLNDLGYEVYALDARGYGKTPRDASGWLTPDRAVQDAIGIIQWIKRRTGQPLHVYGWSYGSMVTQLVAQRQPELMSSIILFGYPFDPGRHVISSDQVYPAKPPAKKNTRSHAISDFVTSGAISDKAIKAYADAALKSDPIRVDFRNLHEWQEMDARKISTPTLLLQAEFDPIAPTAIQQALFTNISTSKKWWVVLAGGDHAALLETPRQEMLNAMDAFMRSLSPFLSPL